MLAWLVVVVALVVAVFVVDFGSLILSYCSYPVPTQCHFVSPQIGLILGQSFHWKLFPRPRERTSCSQMCCYNVPNQCWMLPNGRRIARIVA